MGLMAKSNKVRIYRASQKLQHDMNLLRTLEDVNGEDVWALAKTSTMEVLEVVAGVAMTRYMDLWIESRYECDYHFCVELKKSRKLKGLLEVVEEQLVSQATAGATELVLPKTIGFGAGDMVVISDGVNTEEVRVKAVNATNLCLYSDNGLEYTYAAGTLVRASTFWQVIKAQGPEVIGPTRVVTMEQLGRHEAVS